LAARLEWNWIGKELVAGYWILDAGL